MQLTYIRWSMTLIETLGLTIVTDPVFRMLGIRQAPLSYTLELMPQPDLVFISHTHADHFQAAVLRRLPNRTPVWMPAEKLNKAEGLGLGALRGIAPWQSDTLDRVRLTAVPAKHGGGELGLVVEGDRTVYFAGDTSLDRDLFASLADRWRLDAVLLPIGDLRTLGLPTGHMGPKQAAEALRLLGEPKVVVPTHYSGMTLGPLMRFYGTPRKLCREIHNAQLGTVVASLRPLESVQV
jgi:L-ascorbate metabolism protein UlaG (beta-lactamase superfamily)